MALPAHQLRGIEVSVVRPCQFPAEQVPLHCPASRRATADHLLTPQTPRPGHRLPANRDSHAQPIASPGPRNTQDHRRRLLTRAGWSRRGGRGQLTVVLGMAPWSISPLPQRSSALGFQQCRQWVVTCYALAFGSLFAARRRDRRHVQPQVGFHHGLPGSPVARPSAARLSRSPCWFTARDAAGRVRRLSRRPRWAP